MGDELSMVIDGIDLNSATHALQEAFKEVLVEVAEVAESSCDFSIKFSPINRIRLRRALASGTRVAALLGYEDESAAQVMREPDFGSKFEASLKAQSKEFEAVVVSLLTIEFPTTIPPGGDAAVRKKRVGDDPDTVTTDTYVLIAVIASSVLVVIVLIVVTILVCGRCRNVQMKQR